MHKKLYLFFIILFTCLVLQAQKVSNVRASLNSEQGFYEIKYDLSSKADDYYMVELTASLDGKNYKDLKALSGQGLSDATKPGKNLSIFWYPQKDGMHNGNWKFALAAKRYDFILVEGGTFMMGSNDGESVEKPVHEVTLSSFWISKYQVSQKEWQEVMGSKPSRFKGNNLPVERVSWYDAIIYCNGLSIKEGLTPCYSGTKQSVVCNWNANGYRLLTEAEWEYAACGGNNSKGYKYAGSNKLGDVAWYRGNTGGKTQPVDKRTPNELGIYNMNGNVWEWCWDWYDSFYYGKSPQTDPRGPDHGNYKMLRGGSWRNVNNNDFRVAYRHYNYPEEKGDYYGFRVSRAVKGYGSAPITQDIDGIEPSLALDFGMSDPSLQFSENEEEEQNAVNPAMVFVEGGTFMMGSDNYKDERPVHEVTLSSFWINKYQVTQKEWEEVMGSNPSKFKGDNLPVERVSWYDAIEYCNLRSFVEGLTPCYSGSGKNISCNWDADGYRLPTEAEWEYAARGGNKSKGYKYAGSDTLDNVAWYSNNSEDKTHPVGQKSPNELELYDMSGNVYEWCWDRYHKSYYSKSPKQDPRGAKKGKNRVNRGGTCYFFSSRREVADRSYETPTGGYFNGFRVVRSNN